jgi:septum formation protein
MLILASKSAVRNALLARAGLRFESSPAPIDERAVEATLLGKSPAQVALGLAEAKALTVSRLRSGAVVIGADQVLDAGGALLHKPADLAEARAQLSALRGKSHRLHSGVCLARHGVVLWSTVETATLTLRACSDAELDAALAAEGDAVLGSVGGYRLEGPSIALFEAIEGDYFTILGLPLLPLLAALRIHAPGEGFT